MLTRRATALLIFALVFVMVGLFSYVLSPVPLTTRENIALPLHIAPAPFWGCLMAGVGLFAAATAFSAGPQGRDRWGFDAVTGFATAWACSYVAGMLAFGSPTRALAGAALWGLTAGLSFIVSGFPNDRARQ